MFDDVRDHWYWRPGWRAGRSFYTWHITFADRPEIAALHSSILDPETVQLPIRPVEPLQHLRDITRAAITDVWGDDAVPELPELNPHITLAYSNHPAPAAPLAARLRAHPAHTTTLPIPTLTLITLTRTNHLYHWTPQTPLPLT